MLVHVIRFLLCFWCAFIADIFWVLWSNATKPKDKRWWSAIKAGGWAVALAIPAMFNTVSWLTDHTYALAILLGMFAGTLYAVRREQRKLDG
jgi:hypothetical protein